MAPPRTLSLFVIASLAAPAGAQELATDWTVDEVVGQESARGWSLRRDGSQALWIRNRPDKEKDRMAGTLMVMDLPSGESRELSVGRGNISSPMFSPSGRYVSFVSSRDFPDGIKALPEKERGSQIWVMHMHGGMARPLTKVPFGVGDHRGSHQWIADLRMHRPR